MINLFSRGPKIAPIAAADAIAQAKAGTLTLLDVREADEVRASGKAKGAVHVPLSQVATMADPANAGRDPLLSPDRPVAVYCVMGARSGKAAEVLAKLGYAEVYNLGGLADWQKAGGEVEPL